MQKLRERANEVSPIAKTGFLVSSVSYVIFLFVDINYPINTRMDAKGGAIFVVVVG